jgi:hypothetical protein
MADGKTKEEQPTGAPKDDEHELDRIVKHYGITREEARRLIRQHGDNRRDLEAAAGQLKAKRIL